MEILIPPVTCWSFSVSTTDDWSRVVLAWCTSIFSTAPGFLLDRFCNGASSSVELDSDSSRSGLLLRDPSLSEEFGLSPPPWPTLFLLRPLFFFDFFSPFEVSPVREFHQRPYLFRSSVAFFLLFFSLSSASRAARACTA